MNALSILAMAALVAAIAVLIARFPEPAVTAPAVHDARSYGTPEYVIEVPSGYEGLLPDGAGSPGKPRGTAARTGVPSQTAPIPPRRARPGKAGARTIAIVIDDAGYSLRQLEPFLRLPFPLTVAVLPGLHDSAESARRVLAAGKELILHQPMEALGKQDPGPGAILLSMGGAEAAAILGANLDSLPGASGVNNHMGSAVTRDRTLMEAVLSLAKARGIYYLDSLTTPETVVREAGLGLEMNTWERDVFLDNAGDRESILEALREGRRIAAYKGPAILIGHAWSNELASALMDFYPQLVAEGYSLSTISRLMIQEAMEEGATTDAAPGN